MSTIPLYTDSIDRTRVTVVVVNWNTSAVTCKCLQSLLDSEHSEKMRIVVVDNGSTDDSTEKIAKDFPEIQLIQNSHNRGFAAANNQVLRDLVTDYVLLLNSDTLVQPGVVKASINFMDENKGVGVMGCRVLNPDGTPQLTCGRYPHLRYLAGLTLGFSTDIMPAVADRYRLRSWPRDTERSVDTVTGCYMMVRRTALQQVGLMDEGFFFYGEETDWCRRFRLAGWKLRFAPVGEIVHFGSLSARKLSYQRDVLLTAGLVRLHIKYGGRLKGLYTWFVLSLFNVSRAVYWILRSSTNNSPIVREKARHFTGVCSSLSQVWSLANARSHS